MCAVLYRRTAAVIKMASLLGIFFCRRFVCCCCWPLVVGRWLLGAYVRTNPTVGIGVVHANVGQKLFNCFPIKFSCQWMTSFEHRI